MSNSQPEQTWGTLTDTERADFDAEVAVVEVLADVEVAVAEVPAGATGVEAVASLLR